MCFTLSLSHTEHTAYTVCHRGGPPRGLREQGKQGIYFRGTGEQRPSFGGNKGTWTILGNREHKKFQGNKGTGTPTLGGPQPCKPYIHNCTTEPTVALFELHSGHSSVSVKAVYDF